MKLTFSPAELRLSKKKGLLIVTSETEHKIAWESPAKQWHKEILRRMEQEPSLIILRNILSSNNRENTDGTI